MKTFKVELQCPFQSQVIEDVVSFVAADRSGSFGIRAQHERTMTVLDFGFACVHAVQSDPQFVAYPGGIMYFVDNRLFLVSSCYFISHHYKDLLHVLNERAAADQEKLKELKESLKKMEESMYRRLFLSQRKAVS